MTRVLTSLDFTVEPVDTKLLVTVPGHRPDVEGRADLAEEIARITGYDEIPTTLPTGAPPEPYVEPLLVAGEQAKDVLVASGLREVKTYSMVAPGSEQVAPEAITGLSVAPGGSPPANFLSIRLTTASCEPNCCRACSTRPAQSAHTVTR